MDRYLYISLDIGSIFIPLLYSVFEKKFHFIQHIKLVLVSILAVMVPFIIWDVIFTINGIWGFNERYHLPFTFLKLPMEEWLFFVSIPYACLFTHEAIRHYIPNWKMATELTKKLNLLLIVIAFFLIILNLGKTYTTINLGLFLAIMVFTYFKKTNDLSSYIPSFIIILLPFLAVNGILTGTLLDEPIVWYNNEHNMGIRVGTIPLEDVFYAFNLLFSIQLIFNHLKRKKPA